MTYVPHGWQATYPQTPLQYNEVGGYRRTTEEGKDFYKTINGISHKNPESLCSLFFINRILSWGSSKTQDHTGWATRRFCWFPAGVHREPFTKFYPVTATQKERERRTCFCCPTISIPADDFRTLRRLQLGRDHLRVFAPTPSRLLPKKE